jgi:hypothetical protein
MTFKKTGTEVLEALKAQTAKYEEALQEASARFEKEKMKKDLQTIREMEHEITRFERIIKHTDENLAYELTEQDLIDFGF